jgi:glycerol-3-phosphate acyltransferase PlsY
MAVTDLWSVIVAYLLGAIPTGYLLVRLVQGRNIQKIGSGNIGATNVVRAMGLKFGLAVLTIDAAKGFLAVWLAGRITGGSNLWMGVAAVTVMLGNALPIFLSFRGGKTFATAAGAFLVLAPAAVGAVVPVFLGTAVITRHISAGSIVVGATFPLAVWLILHPGPEIVLAAVAAGVIVLWRHRENIQRLHEGSESKFSWGRK